MRGREWVGGGGRREGGKGRRERESERREGGYGKGVGDGSGRRNTAVSKILEGGKERWREGGGGGREGGGREGVLVCRDHVESGCGHGGGERKPAEGARPRPFLFLVRAGEEELVVSD